jgi:hypothetical protein
MDALRQSARISKLDRKTNEYIWEKWVCQIQYCSLKIATKDDQNM